MSVLVAAGDCFIAGTENANQGTYHGVNDASVNLTVAGADPTNSRLDLVVARVRDSFYSGAFNDFTLQVVTGIAAASPVAPTAPANSITLARIQIPALATSIANANITDYRTKAGLWSGTTVVTSSTRPGTPYTGQLIFETDTGKVQKWSGSAWLELLDNAAVTSATAAKVTRIARLQGPAASLTFSSIAATWQDLLLTWTARSDLAANVITGLLMRFNSDSGNNYNWSKILAQNTTITGSESLGTSSIQCGFIPAVNTTNLRCGKGQIQIGDSGAARFQKQVRGESFNSRDDASGNQELHSFGGIWKNTNAITDITVLPVGGSFTADSIFTLYGLT